MKILQNILNHYYNNKILLGYGQANLIANSIFAQNPFCNMLVFGAGNDSILWHELTKCLGGHTVFLETSQDWLKNVKNQNPMLDIRLYSLEDVTVELSLKGNLKPLKRPAVMDEFQWDVILIDGPAGWSGQCPGRAWPIIWSSQIRTPTTCIFVDDYNRQLEKTFTDKYIGHVNIVSDPSRIIDRKTLLAFSLGSFSVKSLTVNIANASHTSFNSCIWVYDYWLDQMLKIATPVLTNGANDQLQTKLPTSPNAHPRARLEALSRVINGIAPWLENRNNISLEERAKKDHFAELARKAIANIVNPTSKDCVDITEDYKPPLVDAAFLAQGILRAKNTLWHALDADTKTNLITFLRKTRKLLPYRNNWILFSAMVETFLNEINEETSPTVIDYALSQFDQWYAGDGCYKDGAMFHMDYYNSFVIHPMLIDIITRASWLNPDKFIARAQRYAEILLKMIAPDGSYPLVGRSITYRMGAFHLLSQLAYMNLHGNLSKAQIRCALTAVLKRFVDSVQLDENGWLKTGIAAEQKNLAEPYISTASLYLCLTFFLPLGLPPSDPFWTAPDEEWPSVAVWSGKDIAADKARD